MIKLTESAKLKILEIIKDDGTPNLNLRMYIEGGGCSGFNYGFVLEESFKQDDHIVETGDFKLLVDIISMEYLKDSTLDFKKTLMGSNFIISNPNAKATCGCGSSFSA